MGREFAPAFIPQATSSRHDAGVPYLVGVAFSPTLLVTGLLPLMVRPP
jgi:hypothetical protein